MAQLGRLQLAVLNSTGDGTANASVEVRLQGATVNGTVTISSGGSVTIHDPGALQNTDGVEVWNRDSQSGTGTTKRSSTIGATTQFTVGSLTATTLVLTGFSGTLTLTDGDRISLSAPTASSLTLYKTAFGTGTFSSATLTTDSAGRAFAYATGGYYDYISSGTGITTTLFTDIYLSAGSEASNLILSGTQAAIQVGTSRTQTAGRLFQVVNNATVLMHVHATTGLTIPAGGITITGNSTITGTLTALTGVTSSGTAAFANVTASGTLGVTGATTLTGALTANGASTFSSTLLSSGSLSVTGAGNGGLTVAIDTTSRITGPLVMSVKTDLASAAALAVPTSANYFRLTGNTTITSFTGGQAGQIIFLQAGTQNVQINNGNNIVNVGNVNKTFNGGNDDIAAYIYDGTNWINMFFTNN